MLPKRQHILCPCLNLTLLLSTSATPPFSLRQKTPQPTEPAAESRELVQLMVIGSAQGIESTIQNLHLRGFAHINEWSLIMPHSSGKLMRVLTRWVQQQP
jgi:hypothetical protein